jgi:response regulator RpfG family c-di-GMP phosphodiesterase
MTEILLVAFSGKGPHRAKVLREAGHNVILVETAEAARDVLKTYSPDLLIAEIRLGPFNGLHVLIRHQVSHPRMRAILVDRAYDPVLADDAREHGAAYLSEPVEDAKLLEQVSREITHIIPRRWPRKQPIHELTARIESTSARVVDLSYGGARLEIATASEVPQQMRIAFPRIDKAFVARAVWTHPVASGMLWCGVELFTSSATAETEWRLFVDSVPASA